jgi:hypothetical protein
MFYILVKLLKSLLAQLNICQKLGQLSPQSVAVKCQVLVALGSALSLQQILTVIAVKPKRVPSLY